MAPRPAKHRTPEAYRKENEARKKNNPHWLKEQSERVKLRNRTQAKRKANGQAPLRTDQHIDHVSQVNRHKTWADRKKAINSGSNTRVISKKANLTRKK